MAALSLLAAGCTSDGPSEATVGPEVSSATPDGSVAATDPHVDTAGSGATATTVAGISTGTAAPVGTTPLPLGDPAVAFTQLGQFGKPVEVSFRPTDGTTYVVQQDGKIVIMTDGRPGPVALDMTGLTSADGERGLLGMAITKDGTLAYVDYTNNDGNTRIDEYAVGADGTFDKSTRRGVLGFDQPYPNHNGGDVVFGPDGMLYIGTGDGGSGGDPDRRALNKGEWLGKMLRIDPHATASAAYTVPADNPFVGVDRVRPEIWSIGLRNPWRFSFDRSTGDLWIADVGQGTWEEVDAGWAADGGGRGVNFGWSAMEGNHVFNADQSPDGVTPPVHEYEHVGSDCSISGSALYRGTAIPALVGYYVFADYCSGQVRALQIVDHAEAKQVALGHVDNVVAINEGPDGELFVLSGGGAIYAVTPG
ncbi:MAG: PQQ-dependent sugar dehydrogenase [Ilumatobacteraceae bacterium]